MISVPLASSNDPVGSSASNTFGSLIKARAIATLCFSPPLNLLTICFSLLAKPTNDNRSWHFLIFLLFEM